MKQTTTRNKPAFTLIEVIVVVCVVGFIAVALLPLTIKRKSAAQRVSCMNNLKEIGVAYRLWASDCGDNPPALTDVALGGWRDLLTNANQGAICWTNYAIMQNDLGQSPKLVLCPSDERSPAASFSNHFDNSHLSYFIGVSACDVFPQSIQGGDRNLGNGPDAYREYGFSPASGKGNDVSVQTNSLFKPVSWSSKMHSGFGNILLGDGSAQHTSSTHFRQDWLPNADPTTNWPAHHIPASPSIRLVFP